MTHPKSPDVLPPCPIDYEASRRVPDFLLPKLQIERAELDIFLWSEEPEGGGWLKFRRWSVKILPPDINSGTYLISIFTCNLQHQMQISDHIVYYRESSNSLSKVPTKNCEWFICTKFTHINLQIERM